MSPSPFASSRGRGGRGRLPDSTISPLPMPPLTLERQQLFPDDLIRQHGLHPPSAATLEITNGSCTLFKALLFYAAHHAVDLSATLAVDPTAAAANDSTASTTATAAPTADDAAANDAAMPDSTSSPNDAPPNDAPPVADGGATGNDITTKPKQVPLRERTTHAKPLSSAAYKATRIIRGTGNVPIPRREAAGHLSTLWHCPNDGFDRITLSDSDTDSDSGSDFSDPDIPHDFASPPTTPPANATSSDQLFAPFHSLGSLRKKPEPPLQRYQMGLGYAKLALNGRLILLRHVAYGMPVPEGFSIQLYRMLVLVAETPLQLKEFCAVALKWSSDRDQASQRPRPGRFTLFRFKTNGHGGGDWCNEGYKRSRPPKSVILQDGQIEAIIRDMKDFVAQDTKTWYEAHGLPHRRSYLFHGPPGCGKTSTIKMIAGMFRLNACFLSLTSSDFSNQNLQDGLASIPRRALLVLEDVDVLFNEDRKSEASPNLTFSGLLNALDGLISVDGIITIFTTNHIEKLDAALIRGGRVDRRFEFVHPNAKQLVALFKSFYESASDQLAARFSDIVLNRPEEEARSIATLQQHFIFTRKLTAEQSVEAIPKFFVEFYPKGGKSRNPLYI